MQRTWASQMWQWQRVPEGRDEAVEAMSAGCGLAPNPLEIWAVKTEGESGDWTIKRDHMPLRRWTNNWIAMTPRKEHVWNVFLPWRTKYKALYAPDVHKLLLMTTDALYWWIPLQHQHVLKFLCAKPMHRKLHLRGPAIELGVDEHLQSYLKDTPDQVIRKADEMKETILA